MYNLIDVCVYLMAVGKCEKQDFHTIGETYDTFIFDDPSKAPSEQLLKANIENASAYFDALKHNAQAENSRKVAYRNESDPIFLKSQRGEATHQDWLDAVAAIKARYPMVDVPE